MYRIFYRLIAGLARLAVRSGRAKDLEIVVLRHQLTVLRRQVARPGLDNDDRMLLGAVAQALPRPRRVGWLSPRRACCDGTANVSPAAGPTPRHDADVHPPRPRCEN